MTYLLPPLNALRAFEAAARHLSFKLAAQELHVTPGAVGQQVKALENRLGVRLFERLHRQLVLTEAAQAFLPEVGAGLRRLASATARLRPPDVLAMLPLRPSERATRPRRLADRTGRDSGLSRGGELSRLAAAALGPGGTQRPAAEAANGDADQANAAGAAAARQRTTRCTEEEVGRRGSMRRLDLESVLVPARLRDACRARRRDER
jgi:hypothetical protein